MAATPSSAELAEKLRAIRESIRKSIDESAAAAAPSLPPPAAVPPPALEPFRAAQQLAAHHAPLIGAVNPRPAGMANALVQTGKRALARLFGWMLRPQREYNQAVVDSLDRLAAPLEQQWDALRQLQSDLRATGALMAQQDRRIQLAEETTARTIARQASEIREDLREQRWSYEGALARHLHAVEEARQRLEDELRELRRRVAAQATVAATRPAGLPAQAPASIPENAPAPSAAAPSRDLAVDYFALEKDFRGTEVEIRERQRFYLPFFRDCRGVLDIACGRGEFLELMKSAGVSASGVDLNADMVGRCLEKGLAVVQADVFAYLAQVPDGSLGGIFSAQFVEHLDPADYTRLVLECSRKLSPGGVLAIETQNPECLAIFSQSFYIDPTHVRPIPPAQLRHLFAEAGLHQVSTHYLSPSAKHLPVVPELLSSAIEPDALKAFNSAVGRFNETFFGGMDYAIIGRRPGPAPES